MRRNASRLRNLALQGQDLLVMSHGHAIGKLFVILTGEGKLDAGMELDNTSVTILEPGQKGMFDPTLVNSTDHLR